MPPAPLLPYDRCRVVILSIEFLAIDITPIQRIPRISLADDASYPNLLTWNEIRIGVILHETTVCLDADGFRHRLDLVHAAIRICFNNLRMVKHHSKHIGVYCERRTCVEA